ncbi:MAG: type IV pilus assembly protein PilB [Microgenomates group bacterium Gr01-1014_16]|nr:MAG: type IV pilus assembly protein PilB [Microgenomates group bacterium Gr01-1014_16]
MSVPFTNEQLYQAVLELGVVAKEDLESATKEAGEGKLGEKLVEEDLVTDENLGKIGADLAGVPLVRLTGVEQPGEEILRIVPEVVARAQRAVVFAADKEAIKLAMNDPKNRELAEFVAKKTGEKVEVYYATPRDLEQALAWYKRDLQETFDQMLDKQVKLAKSEADWEAPVAKMVDLLIEYAYGNRASDIHIEPEREEAAVRFRVDGILRDVLKLPKNMHDQVVTKIKVAAKLRTDERLSAQDGKMRAVVPGEELDIRVSVVPIIHGEKVVMRLLSAKSRQFGLADLGMSETDLEKVKAGFTKPFGMVLSTGPTGSGKTTTIYAILKILNQRNVNIATIEDPVEYDMEGVNQIQANPKTNLTFASGLRAILRQDPNIIFVGEIRDGETADIAVNSAMTGHLVLSTLHTNDAATTLPRLIDMKIEPFLVASTVNVILGQRLVRKICEKCRVSREAKDSRFKIQDSIPMNIARVYEGKGCAVCRQTGYAGRVGIFEVLEVSEKIKELIMNRADAGQIKKQAVNEGMKTMMEDGLDKVREGITTIEEVLRATRE